MTDFNWKPYIALQREWVEKNGLKVGDRVRILRKAIDFENDWMGVWCKAMDGYVGKVVNVLAIYSGDIIIGADGHRTLCPYFVLEKATKAESTMYTPSIDQETLLGAQKEKRQGDKAKNITDEVKPAGNSEKMTLSEFAYELRRVFRFKFLAISGPYCADAYYNEPHWVEADKDGPGYWVSAYGSACQFEPAAVDVLDLSEYENRDGEIDYSKCIVEVDDDQHMA